MQIDWLTVAAQIVNFLVLIWLLQRFLYRPITTAMARREARIEERLSDARARRREAEDEAGRLRSARETLEASRQQILGDARAEADALRQRLEQEIRDETEQKRRHWHEALAEERDDFIRDMQRRAGHKVLDVAGRLLAEFNSGGLDDQIAQSFVEKLTELDDDTRKRLTAAARNAKSPALVETADALDAATRRKITRAIHQQVGSEIEVAYREDDEVLLGLRLSIGEQTMEWSAARHLERLNRELDDILDAAGPGKREKAAS